MPIMDEEQYKKLRQFRQRIDEIDIEILNLLKERLKLALDIGKTKDTSLNQALDVTREREVFSNILNANQNYFPEEGLRVIFGEIISACRNAQRPLKISFLGPETTYTHMAGVKFFGESPAFLPATTIKEVFEAIERKRCDFGVIPIENSVEGTVALSLDCLYEYDVKICGEIFLSISHFLMNQSGRIETIKRILSHPHALAQCRLWLQANLPAIPTEEVVSTAQAARWASVDPAVAAIASPLAARRYELQVVAPSIEDFSDNTTRFLILGQSISRPSGNDKTSLILSLDDKPGSLYKLLQPFAERGVNLSKIQSRPIKKEPWRYLFYVDVLGHIDDKNISEGIDAIKEHCTFLRCLGSYPVGKE